MKRAPGRDLVAGLTVGVVALPLALGFGISSGLGAEAGLITAIIAGTVAALFGGSSVQVSGPTGAMTVVLVPIVAQYGASGVLVVGLIAGAMLVGMALAGLGAYVRFIPLPVIEGFTLGIAIIIALQQIPGALGLEGGPGSVTAGAARAVSLWAGNPGWAAPAVAGAVAAVMLVIARYRPVVPGALIAVAGATWATWWFDLPIATIGALPSHLPAPSLPNLTGVDVQALILPAVAVASLAALESLLSATVADAMSVSSRHDPDRELFGQGLANLVSPLFGGIPATAAIARTAVNVRSGAVSRLASLTHAAVLLLVVATLTGAVSRIPIAALAGVLIATAIRMVEVASLRALLGAGRGEALVLITTCVATVALDLATAVLLGIVVAGGLAVRQAARTASLSQFEMELYDDAAPAGGRSAAERELLAQHVLAYRFDGPLFFGGAHTALRELTTLSSARVVILRMAHVTSIDATGAAVLDETIRSLEHRGITVLVSGLPTRFHAVLEARGVLEHLRDQNHLFPHTPEAIVHAHKHAARRGPRPGSPGHHHPGESPGLPNEWAERRE